MLTTHDTHAAHQHHHHDHHDDRPPGGPSPDHDHGHERHDGHAAHDHTGHAALFRRLFWQNLILAIPVVVFSHMVQDWFGYRLDFVGADLVAPVLGTVVFALGGRPFLRGGRDEIRARQPGMMLLIVVAITVAFGASLASSIGVGDLDFWWELAALIVVMLLGHWQEMRAIGQASGALDALAELLPDTAERVHGDHVEVVTLDDLRVGDIVLVRPGGRIAADGTIVDGTVDVDESMVTGESRPVRRSAGERVVAGTIATDSAVRVRVDALGENTTLAGIRQLVADAQASRSRAQALADRAAAALFALAMTAAIIAFVAWSAVGSPGTGVVAAITVLVIACPHALGLAIPLVVSISTAASAKAGIIVKDRLALERMRTVDTILFDKTGTLTKGNHAVVDVATTARHDIGEMLALAAAVERSSEHPVARAIVARAEAAGTHAVADTFEALPGRGVLGSVDGHRIAVGGPALLAHLRVDEPADLASITATWRSRGNIVLHVVRDDEVIGAITLADEIRPESRRAIDALHEHGIRVVLLTGDARQVADAVARDLGIDDVVAEVQPADKDHAVATLQAQGRRVAMVGDGINDAPALSRADVGIAIGAGTDVAVQSAGVVLASDDPRAVIGVIDLSRAGYRKMIQNLVWATGYNLASLPVAAGALAFAGITVPPALAAVAMSASTIIVAANAQLLRRLDLRPEDLAR